MLPVVKICGLTRVEDAGHAESTAVAYLGAILAGGPRLVSISQARLVLGPRRTTVQRVAVFGSHSVAEVLEAVEVLDLDVAQLHGGCSAGMIEQLRQRTGCTVWPVLRIDGTTMPDDAIELASAAGAVVIDAHVVGQLGGTGIALDWSGLVGGLSALRRTVPGVRVILAGGLRPGNVNVAIRLLSPDVVDVSSGVECAPGVKDPVLVEQFVAAVRTAAGMQQ